jgi:excisionase family DNA binding protein
MNRPLSKTEVLTLAEAARFLRVTPGKLRALAEQGELPGRKIKQGWRFLKAALEDWLRGETDPTTAMLQQAGLFKDDDMLPEILKDIYRARGRPKDGEMVF